MHKLTTTLIVGAVVLIGAGGQANARTWHVPTEVPTIAAAIDSAAAGDVVELAAGVYGESNLSLKTGLTIRADDPENGATIDAMQTGRIFYAGLCDSLILEGLTLTGGLYYNGAAGNIQSCQGVEIRDCAFVANHTTSGIGGALQVSGESSIVIENCLFQENTASMDDGGAIWLSCPAAAITGCSFIGNQAINGAGISCTGENVHISDCIFAQNRASNGGGLDLRGDTVVISDCLFAGNTATRGGAAGCWYGATPLFTGCTMVENTASDQGGGLYCTGGSVASVERLLLAFNAGGGSVACVSGGSASLVCSDVYGNVGGDWTGCLAGQAEFDGNFSLDPLFCPSSGGTTWELSSASPCLPAGSPCGLLVGAFGQGCGVSGAPGTGPSSFLHLLGNQPNPFNPSTSITFSLEGAARVDLRVFDLRGRLVDVLLEDFNAPQGRNEVVWQGRDQSGRQLPSGTYFYQLEAGGYVEAKTMTMLK